MLFPWASVYDESALIQLKARRRVAIVWTINDPIQ